MSSVAYVVLHTHSDNLVMSQQQRDAIFTTGHVIAVMECPTYSLQATYVKHIPRRPLVLVLWDMHDRYDVANEIDVQCVEVRSFHDAWMVCQHKRCRKERQQLLNDEGETYEIEVEVWFDLEGAG